MKARQEVTDSKWVVREATCDECGIALKWGDCNCAEDGAVVSISGGYPSVWDGQWSVILCDKCLKTMLQLCRSLKRALEFDENDVRANAVRHDYNS